MVFLASAFGFCVIFSCSEIRASVVIVAYSMCMNS